MDFDLSDKPIGYKLGALLAVYEKIQYDANKGFVGSSLKDRFFSSLSTRPSYVLGSLSRLSENHLKKLDRMNKGHHVNLKKRLDQVMKEIEVENLPGHMGPKEQSYFAIGYYQQRQEFFKKQTKETNKEGEAA